MKHSLSILLSPWACPVSGLVRSADHTLRSTAWPPCPPLPKLGALLGPLHPLVPDVFTAACLDTVSSLGFHSRTLLLLSPIFRSSFQAAFPQGSILSFFSSVFSPLSLLSSPMTSTLISTLMTITSPDLWSEFQTLLSYFTQILQRLLINSSYSRSVMVTSRCQFG